MGVSTAACCWMLIVVWIASVSGKPASTIRTQKRQSDQRVAELETLLALQKYGAHHHFLRAQSGDGAGGGGGRFSPAYGIIDFNKIGRKKKASPPSPEVNDWLLSPLAASSSSASSSSQASSSSSNNNPSSEMMTRMTRTSFRRISRNKNNWTRDQDPDDNHNSPPSLESLSSDDDNNNNDTLEAEMGN